MDFFIPLLLDSTLFPGSMLTEPSIFASLMLSLMFSVILTALVYMFGYFLQHPPLIATGREEMGALLVTVLLCVGWIGMEYLIATVSTALLCDAAGSDLCSQMDPGVTVTHVEVAEGAIQILKTKLMTMYVDLYLYEVLVGFLSTISFPLGSPFPGPMGITFSLMPFDGLALLSSAHTTIVETIGYLLMVVMAKKFLLGFVQYGIPGILLPAGILLRAFPFFRTTGSSLIAICIVGYFVYPFAVLFSNFIIFDVYRPADFTSAPTASFCTMSEAEVEDKIKGLEDKEEEMKRLFKEETDTIDSKMIDTCPSGTFDWIACAAVHVWNNAYDVVSGFFKTVWEIGTFMWTFTGDLGWSIFNGLLPSGAVSGLYYFIIDEVTAISQFIVLVMITSVIEIIITITMYRNVAGLIGGEIEIMGLTKIV